MLSKNRKVFFFFGMLCMFLFIGATSCKCQGERKTAIYKYVKASSGGTGKFYMGREIAHVMSAANAAWLERNNRQEEENSDLAISKFPLTSTSIVADIGAGSGYYTFRIASKVTEGKIYAVEIQDEFIDMLKKRKGEVNAKNIEIIKGGSQSPNLPDASVDLAIMVDVYHELLYPHEMLKNIRKALKPGGKLLLLEYKAEDPAVAIRALHKMSVAQVNKELKASGFTLEYQGKFLPLQHLLVYGRSESGLKD